jgi:translation initiation factor 3 subunit F
MITEAGPLNLKLGATAFVCKVHPTVLVTICDSYIRRPAGSARVIGTLLGQEGADNSIVVKACYAVPHEETEEQVRFSNIRAMLSPRRHQHTFV